jgi:hypothetical protein
MNRHRIARTTFEAFCSVACLVASSALVGTGVAGAVATHPRSDRTAPGPSYGIGPRFCTPWMGLSHDGLSVGGVYPCANPIVHDAWGETGAADFVNRYEWADDGLVARVAAGEVVRDLRTDHKVRVGTMGNKKLPGCGDVISMFGGAGTSPAGFAGVVVAVNVNTTGTGTITFLDEDGTLDHGRSDGEDRLRVAAWRISTGWKGSAAYTQFDWTLQTGGWQCASEVPGTAKLNAGRNGGVSSVSCASPGNCAAGGWYSSSMGKSQAMVADEVAGTWEPAVGVPGSATLNAGDNAGVNSVSCASPGNCTAGGGYGDSTGGIQALVADEVAGTWKPAVEVPGSAALNLGDNAWVNSVSCASPGNCTAGGSYSFSFGDNQAFVADEVAGTWKPAVEVPRTSTLNVGGNAGVGSVSCASPGNCAAGGWYSLFGGSQAFVADEIAGTWKPAVEVPGSAKLNVGMVAEILSVSCASPGNCTAGGDYEDSSRSNQAWVADEVAGTWRPVTEVRGTAAFNAGGYTRGAALTAISSVSCASPGDCVAGGYEDYAAGREAIVAVETGGVWQRATEVPGTSVLNAAGGAEILSVSCASPGNCAAGGGYEDRSRSRQAFVADDGDSR